VTAKRGPAGGATNEHSFTWAKSRADIIAHVALLFIVFVVCGASLPGTG
jgi:hypothetical protein